VRGFDIVPGEINTQPGGRPGNPPERDERLGESGNVFINQKYF